MFTFHSGRFCVSVIRYRFLAAASLTMNDALSRYCFGSEKIAVTSAAYVNDVALPVAAVTVVMFDAVFDDSSPCGWPVPDQWNFNRRVPPPVTEQLKRWVWAALKAGNPGVARKHAAKVLKMQPFAIDSWRVMYCALRGH